MCYFNNIFVILFFLYVYNLKDCLKQFFATTNFSGFVF